MSQKKPTIWMNLTTSKNWQGLPVGIVRTENSLCEELKKLYGIRFKSCVWNGRHFQELLPESSISSNNKKNETSLKIAYNGKSSTSLIYPLLAKRQAIKAILQGILSLTPFWLSSFLSKLFFNIRPPIIRLLNRIFIQDAKLNKYNLQAKALSSDSTKEIFVNGDILLSVGLDWDYSLHQALYSLRKNHGIKVVTCCYDIIPIKYPQYCVFDAVGYFESYFLEIADASDLILCISRQSEKDLHEMLHRTGGPSPSTQVFTLGSHLADATREEISKEVQQVLQEPYILYVSTIERRKNHEVLYRAYHLLCKEGKSNLPKLVFVGMQGWGTNELLKDIELDPLTKGLIVILSHVNDNELRRLYESSLFCVFPSLYEGWGLPVAEALSIGKVVISSNRGALPEVGEDFVRYVEPWDVQAWANEIFKMTNDNNFRVNLEKKIRNNYQEKKWSDAAHIIFSSINNLKVAKR